jgi:DNA repair exonuclease SbcCD ATPase subunit
VKDRLAPIVAGDKAKGESRIEGPIEFVGDSESGESDPTNKLLEDPTQCLACGNEPGEEQFEAVKQQYEKIDSRIRDQMSDLNDEQDQLKEEITEIKTGAEELEALERDVEEHGKNLIGIVEGIEDVKRESIELSSAIEGAREELREVQEELDSIVVGESNASSDEQAEYEARLEEVEAEKKELEEKLESKRAKHAAIDRDLEELRERKEELEASIEEKDEAGKKDRLERIEARYDELRGVVDEKEDDLIEWFNGTMVKVVDELAFENIARVWIEKRETQVRDGRQTVEQTVFDLHVIRDGENGVYECKREHLSESERNVIGLVLAITGYLVHDVADTCPVVLLDSIEMMDADRVAKFLDVLANVIPNRWTIAALLPDHVTESTEIVADDMEEFTSPAAVSFGACHRKMLMHF